jgi:hypothetical protein
VDHDILGLDRGEAIPPEIPDALGKPGGIGREQKIGPLIGDQLLDIDQTDEALGNEDIFRRNFKLVGQEFEQVISRFCIR